jgi:AcrR family transcriptional regulator
MASAPAPRGALREVTRRAVQAEIAGKAMELFLEQGFNETTIDQVAAAVGMSGRSVFRYFATKEDMVLGDMLPVGHDLAAALAARPVEESPWEALRRALDEPLAALNTDGGRALARATMLATTPVLRAAAQQKHAQWEQLLVPRLVQRVEGPAATRELRAHAIVSAALSCLEVATGMWVRSGGTQALDFLLDTAIQAVRS